MTAQRESAWRCFVAVPIGEELRRSLAAIVAGLRTAAAANEEAWRWTDPEGWHVTLAFLGSTPTDAVLAIGDRLRTLAATTRPFRLTTGGVGGFPAGRRARVTWYAIADPERRLATLATAVRGALAVDEARPFHAHLTLARARDRDGAPLPAGFAEASFPRREITVEEVILFRSHLGRGPARYEPLLRVPLGAAER